MVITGCSGHPPADHPRIFILCATQEARTSRGGSTPNGAVSLPGRTCVLNLFRRSQCADLCITAAYAPGPYDPGYYGPPFEQSGPPPNMQVRSAPMGCVLHQWTDSLFLTSPPMPRLKRTCRIMPRLDRLWYGPSIISELV
jgi:hypothetical protein